MRSASREALEREVLEDLVTRGWHYLFRFQAFFAAETQSLARFLDDYYAQLEGWLKQPCDAGGGGETSLTIKLSGALPAQRKTLYRDVVKRCHPDIAAPHCRAHAEALLREAVQAYHMGDTVQLVSLRLKAERHAASDAHYLQFLQQEYTGLQQRVRQIRHAVETLRASPAYRLQQKILHARQAGYDLLAVIVTQLRNVGGKPPIPPLRASPCSDWSSTLTLKRI
jgi:hypothetical protein